MEGTWTIEPPRLAIGAAERMGRGGEGRGGRGGRACGTYPAKSAEGQSSPLREEEKEKEKETQGSVQPGALRNSTELRQEAGFVIFSTSLPAPPRRTSDPGREGTGMLSARGQARLSPLQVCVDSTWQSILGGNEGALSPAPCLAHLGIPGVLGDGDSAHSELLPFLAMEEVCEASPAETRENGELGVGPSFTAALTASRGPPVVTCHPRVHPARGSCLLGGSGTNGIKSHPLGLCLGPYSAAGEGET